MSIKQLMRRAAVVMIALVVAGCQVGGANPSPAAPAGSQTGLASGGAQKLVVGYVALNATQLPSWVAKEQGIFDKNGLDVDLQYLQGGSSPTAALLSGQVSACGGGRTRHGVRPPTPGL